MLVLYDAPAAGDVKFRLQRASAQLDIHLLRTDCWCDRGGTEHLLDHLDCSELENVRRVLRDEAFTLHDQAASDKRRVTSSALGWALHTLGIPAIGNEHPLVWMESMPLMRSIARRHACS